LAGLSINELRRIVPRRYSLGKRGDAKADTRARIVAATLRLYREVGVAGASVPAIARAADVAPATIRNHFPGSNDLAEAAADAVLTALEMPDESIFEGASNPTERVRRLAEEMGAFSERGAEWWEIRERDPDLAQAWTAPEVRYRERLERLVRVAVAPHDDDAAVVAVVRTAVEPLYYALRAAGSSSDEAVAVILSMVLPWLDQRLG
jgi:AcrR family transcriptional regulator